MMRPVDLKSALVGYTVDHCGHEPHRGYLGMSRIAECPRRLFYEIRDGRLADDRLKLRFYKGYQMEADLLNRLAYALDGMAELVAGDDAGEISALGERFLGHPDGELVIDGERVLLEIKSTVQVNLNEIVKSRRIPTRHWLQVQCYMHFGDWRRAFVLYEARDTGALYVHQVRYSEQVGRSCERKAEIVLAALEADEAPECWCERCE